MEVLYKKFWIILDLSINLFRIKLWISSGNIPWLLYFLFIIYLRQVGVLNIGWIKVIGLIYMKKKTAETHLKWLKFYKINYCSHWTTSLTVEMNNKTRNSPFFPSSRSIPSYNSYWIKFVLAMCKTWHVWYQCQSHSRKKKNK